MVREAIQKRMTFPLNKLGIIQKFNGVHANQTREYTHLNCQRYIKHMVDHHSWRHKFVANVLVQMKSYSKYMVQIQTEEGPTDPYKIKQLQRKIGFNY